VSEADRRYMALALTLGARGLGQVWPNPAVGCVVVKNGRIAGRGWTQPGGRPHAEVMALRQAGPTARGATAYITLEPCAHHGVTPPCADALIAAGLTRVVSAMEDSDPRVAGQGHTMLRDAGIAVETGVMAAEAAVAHKGFLTRVAQGRPMVTLKLASSLDGRIATASGESRWITGTEARRAVHALRARHDAVLIGAGTARADDPMLTVRGMGAVHQPVRIVATADLHLPRDGALARSAAEVPLWLVHGPQADTAGWAESGAVLVPVGLTGGRIDPAAMLAALGARGLTRVLCEGGGQLAASLIAADLVDEIVVHAAGLMLGADARPALGPLGLAALVDAGRFRLADVQVIGPDLAARWVREG
jgi:diaminohydroxyphosphoribosylaminopyrimidine deaminase / 5-amino-6-(5-phosphoribosylamino)uracil reductase